MVRFGANKYIKVTMALADAHFKAVVMLLLLHCLM